MRGHPDWIAAELNNRRIVSICDLCADWGEPIEARNEMLVSLPVNWERFAATVIRCSTGEFRAPGGKAVPLGDGTASLAYDGRAGTRRNLLRRPDRLERETPHLHILFRRVMFTLLRAERSTPRTLDRVLGQSTSQESVRVLRRSVTQP